MKVELVSYTKNPIETIMGAAAMCYKSEPNFKTIVGCYESGHTSVFEHANFTFYIEDITRACLAQLTRHRIASYSVVSQRYVDMSDANMYTPNCREEEIFKDQYVGALHTYKYLIERGVKKEDARMVLPNACYTSLYVTMNLRALSNFMNERLCNRAQAEIQELAARMRKVVLQCEDIVKNAEYTTFLSNRILVPKCRSTSIPYCPENKGCGVYPNLKDIVLFDRAELSKIEKWKTNHKCPYGMPLYTLFYRENEGKIYKGVKCNCGNELSV